MVYSLRYIYPKKYEFVGQNQHGERYKVSGSPQVNAIILSAEFNNAADLAILIYLSSMLKVPITWNTKTSPQTASIELVSVDALKDAGVI